jgi:hypothetical protein
VTASRDSGTSGGTFNLIRSDGVLEVALATITFVGAALTVIYNGVFLGISAGELVSVKVPAGVTQVDLAVSVDIADT